jgi:hypothetical protein
LRDANGQGLAYVYYEDEPGQRSAAKMLTKEGAADCGEYRQAAGAVFTNFLSVELGPLRCNATIKTLAST